MSTAGTLVQYSQRELTLETLRTDSSPSGARSLLPLSLLDSETICAVVSCKVYRRCHNNNKEDRDEPNLEERISEENTSQNEVELVKDWKGPARFYFEPTFHEGAKEISEHCSERNHESRERETVVNEGLCKPDKSTSNDSRGYSSDCLVGSKDWLAICKSFTSIKGSASSEH